MKNKTKTTKENSEVEQLRSQLARALADYDNLVKRTEEDRVILSVRVAAQIAVKLLPVLDMIEDAQKHLNDSGLAIVTQEFKSAINSVGIEEMRVKPGQDYSSANMEVVDVIQSEDEANNTKVVEVLSDGWWIKNFGGNTSFVVRPARVKVYNLKKIN